MRFLSANYALFFGELCELRNIFKRKFLIFQFIKLANLLWLFFEYKIIHFQSEDMGKTVVLLPNKSKQGAFFFSKV